jgi:DNA-binding LacI/PurR family transcriptional regulator
LGRRPTLQTVADRVGVSRATVSNAYNRPDQLSPDLRARILACAQELGYAGPDPAARGLRRGRTGTVGFLLGEPLDYAFTDPAAVLFLEGLARALPATLGSNLLVIPSPPGADPSAAVREAAVDAFVAYCLGDGHPTLQAALDRRVPTVLVEGPSTPGAAAVDIDQGEGGRLAAEHVARLGHRHVGILLDRLRPDGFEGWVTEERIAAATEPVTRDRLAGVRAGLAAGGLDPAGVPIHETANIHAAALERARAMLAERPELTAIVATSDVLALATLQAAAEAGRDVPGDLSVTGFDDIPAAAEARPALTTVRQPLAGKGGAAATLLEELAGGGVPRQIVLPLELVVRDSTAPPRA